MKIHLDVPDSSYFIRRVEPQKITLNQKDYHQSLVIHGDFLLELPKTHRPEDLKMEFMQMLSERKPNVLLLGTGKTQIFLEPIFLKPLIEAQIGVEVMSTPAAARTYNILAQDGRNVMGIFLLDANP